MIPSNRLASAQPEPPRLISWNVTRRCNLACPHCYLDAGFRSGSKGDPMTTKMAFAVVDQIARAAPGCMLVLSGGEPLLRPDLPEIAGRAAERGLFVVLGTNGTLLTRRILVRLQEAGVRGIGISLDSLVPSHHDAFRGAEGAWRRATRAMETCREEGFSFQLHTAVTRENYGEIRALVQFAAQKGAAAFNAFFLVCTGRGERLTDIEPSQYEELLNDLAGWSNEFPDVALRARCAPHFVRLARSRCRPVPGSEFMTGCMAGKGYCRIDPEGNVTPCPYLDLPVGNLFETSFREIWSLSAVLNALRWPRLGGRCGRCDFSALCGGCRARAYTALGDLMGEDPWCSYEPPESAAQSRPARRRRWTPEAEARLNRVPAFVRPAVRVAVEEWAARLAHDIVTVETMAAARASIPSGFARLANRPRAGHGTLGDGEESGISRTQDARGSGPPQ